MFLLLLNMESPKLFSKNSNLLFEKYNLIQPKFQEDTYIYICFIFRKTAVLACGPRTILFYLDKWHEGSLEQEVPFGHVTRLTGTPGLRMSDAMMGR